MKREVKSIACGGEHVFAVTRSEQVFGWGRNDSGQLGLGFIKEQVKEDFLAGGYYSVDLLPSLTLFSLNTLPFNSKQLKDSKVAG